MSIQSDAAKAYIEVLLDAEYDRDNGLDNFIINYHLPFWYPEYPFAEPRKWRFDYAVPSILCAKPEPPLAIRLISDTSRHVLELDGGTFQSIRSGHSSGVGLRAWREKNNAAMSAGWHVWHYAPDEVIKAGRKSMDISKTIDGSLWVQGFKVCDVSQGK